MKEACSARGELGRRFIRSQIDVRSSFLLNALKGKRCGIKTECIKPAADFSPSGALRRSGHERNPGRKKKNNLRRQRIRDIHQFNFPVTIHPAHTLSPIQPSQPT